MTPTPGQSLEAGTPIEFDVTDAVPGLLLTLVTLKYANSFETIVVHDGTNFKFPFSSGFSARTVIANGFHFNLLPMNGWTGTISELFVYAVDSAGNLEPTP